MSKGNSNKILYSTEIKIKLQSNLGEIISVYIPMTAWKKNQFSACINTWLMFL